MAHALDLVQDLIGAVDDGGQEILECRQVAGFMVGRRRRLENQPRVSGHAPLNMAVDALRLHDGAGDVVEEQVHS